MVNFCVTYICSSDFHTLQTSQIKQVTAEAYLGLTLKFQMGKLDYEHYTNNKNSL